MRQDRELIGLKVPILMVSACHICAWTAVYYSGGIRFVWHLDKIMAILPVMAAALSIILEIWWLANPVGHSTWRYWICRSLAGLALMIHVRRSPLALALLCSLPIFDASFVEPVRAMLPIALCQLLSGLTAVLWICDIPGLSGLPWSRGECAVYSAMAALMAVISLAVNRLRASLEQADRQMDAARIAATELAKANVRLQDFTVKNEAFVLIRERLRMARDIHDTLGYTLTGAVREIEACEDLLPDEPDRAISLLQHSRTIIRDGLQEVRKSVQALRDPTTAGSAGREHWLKLTEAFAEATGITIKHDIQEDFTFLDADVAQAIYRVIQEGLTNAYRHGHAKLVVLRIWRQNGLILVRVSDNGRGVEQLKAGHGVSGMRERIEALGGRIAWRSEVNRGFDLGVEIPYKEDGRVGAQANTDR